MAQVERRVYWLVLAGPGVVGSVAESRESGGRLQNRFGRPEANFGALKG